MSSLPDVTHLTDIVEGTLCGRQSDMVTSITSEVTCPECHMLIPSDDELSPSLASKENLDQFLSDLAELTKKTGIVVCGCGHCGSPFLYARGSGTELATDLEFNHEKSNYGIVGSDD